MSIYLIIDAAIDGDFAQNAAGAGQSRAQRDGVKSPGIGLIEISPYDFHSAACNELANRETRINIHFTHRHFSLAPRRLA